MMTAVPWGQFRPGCTSPCRWCRVEVYLVLRGGLSRGSSSSGRLSRGSSSVRLSRGRLSRGSSSSGRLSRGSSSGRLSRGSSSGRLSRGRLSRGGRDHGKAGGSGSVESNAWQWPGNLQQLKGRVAPRPATWDSGHGHGTWTGAGTGTGAGTAASLTAAMQGGNAGRHEQGGRSRAAGAGSREQGRPSFCCWVVMGLKPVVTWGRDERRRTAATPRAGGQPHTL